MIALSLILGFSLQSSGDTFAPTGPKIQVTMQNRKKFTITTDANGSPATVAHIIKLVKKRFYDRQRVHRVESWVVQWGAPASKTKPLESTDVTDGGSGYTLPFEESKHDFFLGVVGIASEGLQLGGDSQLFILKKDTLRLFKSYAVVGRVTEGMEVVGTIQRGDRIRTIRVLRSRR